MKKEFNLSEKEYKMFNENGFKTKDVKEFIKKLKEEILGKANPITIARIYLDIDKLAGEKLIWKKNLI